MVSKGREEIEVWKTIVVEGEGSVPMAFVQDPSATQWMNETMFNLLKQAISWSGAEGKQVYQDISAESGQIQAESKSGYQAIKTTRTLPIQSQTHIKRSGNQS